jgi:hypothetical protein
MLRISIPKVTAGFLLDNRTSGRHSTNTLIAVTLICPWTFRNLFRLLLEEDRDRLENQEDVLPKAGRSYVVPADFDFVWEYHINVIVDRIPSPAKSLSL